jgi:hypothetical protein
MIRFRGSLPFVMAALVGAAMLGTQTQAHAAFTLTITTSGGGSASVTDNGAGDFDSRIGVINYSNTIGNISIQGDFATSNSSTNAIPPELSIINTSITGAAGATVTVTLEDTGFNVPAPGSYGMESQLSLTSTSIGGAVAYTSSFNGTPGTTINFPSSPSGTSVFDSIVISSTPYTLSSVTQINFGTAGLIQTTGITRVVPAPAGLALVLAGLPLLGGYGWLRRRKVGQAV